MKVRSTFYKFPAEMTSEEKNNIFENFDINTNFCDTTSKEIPCSVKTAKILVRSYGGEAYTKFIDRSGKPYQILPLIIGKSKLREIREKAGISQKELAKSLCVTQSTVHNWETYKVFSDSDNMLGVELHSLDFMKEVVKNHGTDFDTLNEAVNAVTEYKNETPEFSAKLLRATLKTDEYKQAFEKEQGKTQENAR